MEIYHPPSKIKLQTMYDNEKSMAEIAHLLHCSIHTIVYWMRKYDIKRRCHSDATYLKENPNGDPFHIKKLSTNQDHLLYGIALGLFWGEGTKATSYSVRLTNTDPAMIKLFRTFLIKICQVNLDKIRYSIVTFNDSNPSTVANYWAKELRISKNKFGTIVSIPPQGKGTYKRKSLYGVCSITVSNIKLKSWITDQIENVKHAWIV